MKGDGGGDKRRGIHWQQISSCHLSKLEEVLSSAMLFLKTNVKGWSVLFPVWPGLLPSWKQSPCL